MPSAMYSLLSFRLIKRSVCPLMKPYRDFPRGHEGQTLCGALNIEFDFSVTLIRPQDFVSAASGPEQKRLAGGDHLPAGFSLAYQEAPAQSTGHRFDYRGHDKYDFLPRICEFDPHPANRRAFEPEQKREQPGRYLESGGRDY